MTPVRSGPLVVRLHWVWEGPAPELDGVMARVEQTFPGLQLQSRVRAVDGPGAIEALLASLRAFGARAPGWLLPPVVVLGTSTPLARPPPDEVVWTPVAPDAGPDALRAAAIGVIGRLRQHALRCLAC